MSANETIAEIVAEMRDVAKSDRYTVTANPKILSPTVFGKPICVYFAEVADRLEAASKHAYNKIDSSVCGIDSATARDIDDVRKAMDETIGDYYE